MHFFQIHFHIKCCTDFIWFKKIMHCLVLLSPPNIHQTNESMYKDFDGVRHPFHLPRYCRAWYTSPKISYIHVLTCHHLKPTICACPGRSLPPPWPWRHPCGHGRRSAGLCPAWSHVSPPGAESILPPP